MQELKVLMSIKPRFVEMILSGEKDIELRRRLPSFMAGTQVFLYSSSPDKAVLGWTFVESIHFLPKEELWKSYGHRTGIEWHEFSSYFKGVSQACGIEMSQPRHFDSPISLETIRRHFQGFRPPQSYQFVKPEGTLAQILAA